MKKIILIIFSCLFIVLLTSCNDSKEILNLENAQIIIANKNAVNDYVSNETYMFYFNNDLCSKIEVKITYKDITTATNDYKSYKEETSGKSISDIQLDDKTISYNLVTSDYLNNNKSNIVDILLENNYYISYK